MQNAKILNYDEKTHNLDVRFNLSQVAATFQNKKGETIYILAGTSGWGGEDLTGIPIKGLRFRGQVMLDPTKARVAASVAEPTKLDDLLARVFGGK